MGLRTVDLFCGAAGGWTLGLHRAGFEVVAAAEKVDWRREMFGRLWGVPVCADVREFTAEWYAENVGSERPFLVCGSPPCKKYSAANSKGGGLDEDDLFLEATRVVDELGPDWVAFENSPRVRTKGYDRIAGSLETIGYTCWPFVVGVANAGAAHRRARVWILAHRSRRAGTALDKLCADSGRQGGADRRSGVGCGRESRPQGSGAICGGDFHPNGESQQGRFAGQPRERGGLPSYSHGEGLRIEQGRRCGPDGKEPPLSLDPSAILGPIGSQPLGSHLRAYHGISARVAELCRGAYGDAVSPIIPELIGRAILKVAA